MAARNLAKMKDIIKQYLDDAVKTLVTKGDIVKLKYFNFYLKT